jgi:cell division inhibitor SepF
MGFSDTFKKLVGIDEVDDDLTEEEIEAAKQQVIAEESKPAQPITGSFQPKVASQDAPKAIPIEKRVSIAGTSTFTLVVIEPKSFDECPKLVDSLKAKRPVVINLEKIETETAKKIFDFLSGATYALNGNVQKVANNIFIFAPEKVDITTNQEERTGFDFGASKSPWSTR